VREDERRPVPGSVFLVNSRQPSQDNPDLEYAFQAEMLGSARRSLWVSAYACIDGPRAFEVLARRMDQAPDLLVTLLLNVQRKRCDTTSAEQLVRRFAGRFWNTEWPGAPRPRV
jgi:hypothetical protein